MSTELTVAVVQMNSIDDVDVNFDQIQNLLGRIFQNANPQLVAFPENCLYMRIIEGECVKGFSLAHAVFHKLSELAQKYNSNLHLGSVPLLIDGVLHNSSVLVAANGEVSPTYQKIHLFDIQLEGQEPIRESDVFAYGKKAQSFDFSGWKIGQTVCYDLRFSELFSIYSEQEVDAIMVPAAFLVKTGQAHWETLLRARAIESQVYILASAQGGTHHGIRGGSRETYGHSLIIDPWGQKVAQVEDSAEGFVVATLSKNRIETIRKQIPMGKHRRLRRI